MILPLTNSEKIQKYESVLANSTNWTSATTSKVSVGDIIIPCSATGTQGTAATGAFVIPAGAASSATTGFLGVVVAVKQRNAQSEVSSVTSAIVGTTNSTSTTPWVVEWIACAENIDWVADIASAVASNDTVGTYLLANSSGGTDSGTISATTFNTSAQFTGYKVLNDSAGALKKVVGRFVKAVCLG